MCHCDRHEYSLLRLCWRSRRSALQLVGQLGELVTTGHLPSELVEADLRPLLVQHGLSELEDDEVIADQVGVVWVVGDEDDTEPCVASRRGVLQDDAGLLDTQ